MAQECERVSRRWINDPFQCLVSDFSAGTNVRMSSAIFQFFNGFAARSSQQTRRLNRPDVDYKPVFMDHELAVKIARGARMAWNQMQWLSDRPVR